MAEAVLIAAVTAGVLLPKAIPALLVPSEIPAAVHRWLDVLPAATLGALTAMAVLSASHEHGSQLGPTALGAVAAAGLVALVARARRRFLRRTRESAAAAARRR